MNSIGSEAEPLGHRDRPLRLQQFVEHHNLVPFLSDAMDFNLARIWGVLAQCVEVRCPGIDVEIRAAEAQSFRQK